MSGRNRSRTLLTFIRVVLAVTFVAVLIANLVECTPLHQHWQVVPDPGPQCRQGYAHLLTLSAASALTDLLLVVFPVPIVLRGRISTGRKVLLVLLFALGIGTVAVAIYRVPRVMSEAGYQAVRTTWASIEILVATVAANALTLGTFMRDTGLKKKKYRYQPSESAVRRVSRATNSATEKGNSWLYDDDDDHVDLEGSKRGRRKGALEERDANDKAGGISDSDRIARSESEDSLIARVHRTGDRQVVKTTTFEVQYSNTHESPGEGKRMALGMLEGAVTASARGKTRGSSILLHDMRPLPGSDGGRSS